MRFYKRETDGTVVCIGTGLGGTEITEEEYNALLAEIIAKAELADRLFSGEITIGEVPAEWQEEIRRRADEMAMAEAEEVAEE